MKYLFFVLFLVLAIIADAQTAFTVVNSHGPRTTSELSVASIKNPWIGGGLLYNIRDDVSDFFRLNARAQFDPITGDGFSIPFVTTVDLGSDTLVADEGVEIGIFPWVEVTKSTGFTLLAHGGLNYTITTGETDGDLFTVMAGLELAIWGSVPNRSPFTLSAAPVLVFQTNNTETQNTAGLEVTSVIPIANGLGFLLQGTLPFDKVNYFTKGIKAGIIVNGLVR